jgi:hypothetical protein
VTGSWAGTGSNLVYWTGGGDSEKLKKELAKDEHDGYDSRHENLPVGSEIRMLQYSQITIRTN